MLGNDGEWNWRGKPLVSYEVIVDLVVPPKEEKAWKLLVNWISKNYDAGIKIKDEEMKSINLEKHDFHGKWNYTI